MAKEIKAFEPWFFMFFGVFHFHRIWGLIDRKSYADFWMGILESKGFLYFAIMILLAGLCVLGMATFFKNRRNNYWWRWIYFFGGGYVLFDLFAIAAGFGFWQELLAAMFDVNAWYWNILWAGFILLGGAVFALGIRLLLKRKSSGGN